MKRFYTLCVVLLVLSGLLLSTYAQANGVGNELPDPATWMPDANLRNAVRAALRLHADEPLTQEKMLNLQGLNASKLGIRDLTGLESAMYLKSLSIGGNQIRNLKPLANLGNLRRLYIGGNRIRHIRHLVNLTNLRRLGMLRNQVTDITVLAGLVNLKYLRLAGNPITDTSPLENLPNLSDVDIEIPSLIPDANLRAAVRAALGIEPNLRITIDAMRNLTTLSATQLGITDLTGLEYATNLRSLSVGGNQISDITPLANLTGLTELYMEDNLISDINPLANLTNLRRLGMLRNQVTDISVLAGLVNLEYLWLKGNPITDTSPLRSLPKLIDVDVDISSPPQQENTQPQGTSTHLDTDPPADDGQQKDDRRQDDSGQSQQQQPPTSPQPSTNPQPQQQQQSTTSPQPSTNTQPQQQPSTNTQQVIEPEPDPEPLQSLQQQQQEEEEEEERDYEAECLAQGGTWYDGVCVRPATPQEVCEALGGTWDDETETCDGVEGLAPSYPKNVFLLDRITLEQLDPATLEAQLGIWLAESDGSALYLRSIALLESVLATMRPDKTHLLPNYPNPFNPETWIPYHLANPSEVQIIIYDTRGTVVRHLDLGHQQAGYYTSRSRAVYWDGCNDIGEKVSSGVYFYQLQTDKTSQLRKMVILK